MKRILTTLLALVTIAMTAGAQTKEAYAVVSTDGTTLTFYYDTEKAAREGTEGSTCPIPWNGDLPGWYGISTITIADFDISFDDYHELTTAWNMFYEMPALTAINNIERLHTEKVTSMRNMFAYSSSLKEIDLSHLDTRKVETMFGMFNQDTSLTTLNVNSFDVTNVTNMVMMFCGCSNLTTIYCEKNWNTGNVSNSDGMFTGCEKLVGAIPYVNTMHDVLYANPTDGYFTVPPKMPYAVLDGSTLTFYYNNQMPTNDTVTVYKKIPWEIDVMPEWASNNTITTVDFDESFADYDGLTNASYMFRLPSLQCINNLDRLNTTNVTSMSNMFLACPYLTNLDLSNFNTEKVTTMDNMFCGCNALERLDVSHFVTDNVTNMSNMFSFCNKLSSLDIRNINTTNVTDMRAMFMECNALENLDVSHFVTHSVTDMRNMFYACRALTKLDVSNFNMENVTDMRNMFYYCTNLTTIYCDKDWYKEGLAENQMSGMFKGCNSLVGGNGTKCSDAQVYDATYAHLDVAGNPGYFTLPPESYAVLSTDNTTLTFYYDGKKDEREGTEGTIYPIPWSGSKPDWTSEDLRNTITTVTFDESFADYDGLTSTSNMFDWMMKITSFNHLDYLNTSNVTDMSYMFCGCTSLTSLVVSELNTSKVTDMSWMFFDCENLKNLDLSNFNTANVKDMSYMFGQCHGLESVNLSSFNTEKVENMKYMFYICKNLKNLDLSNFNTTYVKDMSDMFRNCGALESLDISHFTTDNVTTMEAMFSRCKSLSSLDVTHFNTAKVTSMAGLFHGCESLTSLDLRNFNTANVTDMESMFERCESLTSLDLRSFNTANVTSMRYMFCSCELLKTIICSTDWNTEAVTYSELMFSDCFGIVGGRGTIYDAKHVDKEYARIDGGIGNPGYFTQNVVRGDVNSDNHVDVADVTALVNILATNDTLGDAYVTYDVAVKPTSDYLIATIDLDSSVLGALQSALQLSPSELAEKIVNNSSEELGNDEARFMPVDASGNLVYKVHTGSSGYGYWLNANGEWIGWGVDAYVDVELAYNNGKWQITLNQYPGHNHSGDNVTARLALVYKNAQGKMGTTWFTFNYLFDDAAANTVTLKYVVKPEIPADVNLDGSVTRADVTDLVNIILEK